MSAAASCVLRIELFFFHFLFQRGEEARRATCSGKYAVTSLTWLLGRTPGDRRAWCPLVPWAPAHRPSTVARQGCRVTGDTTTCVFGAAPESQRTNTVRILQTSQGSSTFQSCGTGAYSAVICIAFSQSKGFRDLYFLSLFGSYL